MVREFNGFPAQLKKFNNLLKDNNIIPKERKFNKLKDLHNLEKPFFELCILLF